MLSRAVHHTAATGSEVPVASTKAAEATNNGSLWNHLLSTREPLLRPWDIDVRAESSYNHDDTPTCWMPDRLPPRMSTRGILLSCGCYMQHCRVLLCAASGGL